MLSMSLKCAMEDWSKAGSVHGGRHVLLALQVDSCVFVSGVGDVGHLLLCRDGRPMRVEHTPVASADDHTFGMTYVAARLWFHCVLVSLNVPQCRVMSRRGRCATGAHAQRFLSRGCQPCHAARAV